MDFTLECYPCLLALVIKICKLAKLDAEQSRLLMHEALRELTTAGPAANPPIITGRLFTFAHERFFPHLETFDPFGPAKRSSTELVKNLLPAFEAKLDSSATPLEDGIRFAAAGNIIDFGATEHGALNIAKELALTESLVFAHYDYEPLTAALQKAQLLLLITDNAAEIVLDRLLLKAIARCYPHITTVAAVRGRAVLNDATLEDAVQAGLTGQTRVISSGSIYPGVVLDQTTPEFQKLFAQASVIISKGQGNYETMCSLCDPRMFFLLRIKCEAVAAKSKAALGGLVLLQGSAQPNIHRKALCDL